MDAVRIPEAGTLGGLFRGQLLHVVALVVLVPATWLAAGRSLRGETLLGLADTTWLALGIAAPVVHQVYVWLAWRLQLGWNAFGRGFGDHGLTVYMIGFFPLLLTRPLGVIALGWVTRDSLPLPWAVVLPLAVLLALPAAWTQWSVIRWFGYRRAAGADHFEARYREMPLVRQGAFRHTPNAMYAWGFLSLWVLALLLRSEAALVLVAFQHLYIWVHWHATEKPDMRWIYSS